jgi:hypothetical protein
VDAAERMNCNVLLMFYLLFNLLSRLLDGFQHRVSADIAKHINQLRLRTNMRIVIDIKEWVRRDALLLMISLERA